MIRNAGWNWQLLIVLPLKIYTQFHLNSVAMKYKRMSNWWTKPQQNWMFKLSIILAQMTLQRSCDSLEQHLMIFINHKNWLLHFLSFVYSCALTKSVHRQWSRLETVLCSLTDIQTHLKIRRADGNFFGDKEKQTGWRHKRSKTVREYYKSNSLMDDKSAWKMCKPGSC